jgi:branched-chain amino acid transport system permease protein
VAVAGLLASRHARRCRRRGDASLTSHHIRDRRVIAQAVLSGLLMGCVYALIAAGLSLIFGLMEIVNFAHGELLMLAMFATFWAWALAGLDPVLALPLATALLFGVGWVI